MQLFGQLLDLHELAVREGRQIPARRPLFEVLRREEGRHLTGIVGPRGACAAGVINLYSMDKAMAPVVCLPVNGQDGNLWDFGSGSHHMVLPARAA